MNYNDGSRTERWAGCHCQLCSCAGDCPWTEKKGQGSGNMWTPRRAEKVLSLNHFSWFDSSQEEGKGLRQLTFPDLVHQQNGLSLSHLPPDPKHRARAHPVALLRALAHKAEERPLGHLALLNLAQGWQLSQSVVSQRSILSTCFPLLKPVASQSVISCMRHMLFQLWYSRFWGLELFIITKKSKYSFICCLRKIWSSVGQWLILLN